MSGRNTASPGVAAACCSGAVKPARQAREARAVVPGARARECVEPARGAQSRRSASALSLRSPAESRLCRSAGQRRQAETSSSLGGDQQRPARCAAVGRGEVPSRTGNSTEPQRQSTPSRDIFVRFLCVEVFVFIRVDGLCREYLRVVGTNLRWQERSNEASASTHVVVSLRGVPSRVIYIPSSRKAATCTN